MNHPGFGQELLAGASGGLARNAGLDDRLLYTDESRMIFGTPKKVAEGNG